MLDRSILDCLILSHFDAWGVARIESIDCEIAHLQEWLGNNYNGEMQYMSRNIELRANPRELLPNARSMIMVLSLMWIIIQHHHYHRTSIRQ